MLAIPTPMPSASLEEVPVAEVVPEGFGVTFKKLFEDRATRTTEVGVA